MDRQMMFNEWAQLYRELSHRAQSIDARITLKARAIGAERAGTGEQYCFQLAHNWKDLETITEDARAACREILRLEQRRFRVWAIVRRMSHAMYATVSL